MEIEGHVPEMACGSGSSPENGTVHQRRTTDARAECQQNHIAFSASGTPQHFGNQCGASVVIGIERQASGVNHVRQEPSFEEVQVSGQAVYPRCRSVDNALAADANSANPRLGLPQYKVYKIMQGHGSTW